MLIYTGKAPTDRKIIDLSRTVEETLELVRASLPEGCRLSLDLPAGMWIGADETQIRQVILNLVTNAAEALDDADGEVNLRTFRCEAGADLLAGGQGVADPEPGRYVGLEVQDTGHGMDAATRAHVFEPFFTTRFSGRGMGMASVLGIVRGHGGVILVDSERDRGARLCALLPAAERAEARPGPDSPPPAKHGPGGRVLVVDDDPGVLEVATAFLVRAGFQVCGARGGREAIAQIETEPDAYDAVLLDLAMPDVGGDRAFRELRALRPDLPIVVTTGYSEELAAQRLTSPGVSGFVRKPFDPGELAECVRAAIAGAKA